MKKLLSAFIAITICINAVQAQTDAAAGSKPGNAPASTHRMPVASDYNTWSIGLHVGPTIFSGDIADDAFNQDNFTTSLAYGLHVNKGISHTFGLQAHFLMGKLEGVRQMTSVKYSFESTIKYRSEE